jgi:hypothetical protein
MMRKRDEKKIQSRSRRTFMQSMSAVVPSLTVLLRGKAQAVGATEAPTVEAGGKFVPIDLGRHFNASSQDFGPRRQVRELSGSTRDGLLRIVGGEQSCQGIPFILGPEYIARKQWVAMSRRPNAWQTSSVEIPLAQPASYVCLAAFCDWDANEAPPVGELPFEQVGQVLAHMRLVYEDGSIQTLPIRRRFEVNSPAIDWGLLSFSALSNVKSLPTRLTDPLRSGVDWGNLQVGDTNGNYPRGADGRIAGHLWISALKNPEPDRALEKLHIESVSEDLFFVCGLTLFQGRENPLRWQRLTLYRLTLPDASAEDRGRWKVDVDLGVVARTYALPDFEPSQWLSAVRKGIGDRTRRPRGARFLYVEMSASPEATLTLQDVKSGTRYQFQVGQAVPGHELQAQLAGPSIEIIESTKVWLHGTVTDTHTGKPVPVRLAFRSKEGRYIPPYGHRAEVNAGWFQDYGADVKVMDTPFAYVDGTFQVELPVGEVYLEMAKGFEYEPVRRRLDISPGQRDLKVEISRYADFRSKGWVTADTHTHFLSPTTAVLEAQAEGLNLINLLAAQWGDLFTNYADPHYGPLISQDKEAMVWVGSENRQHVLGHLALLGAQGMPDFRLSASGPPESYLGDPCWTSLADWADTCRAHGGLAAGAHFPYPNGEIAADIALGKLDAVEIWPMYQQHFNSLRFLDWYHYLNCGYRLPAVGGTDKMGANMPAGTNRVYAFLGQEEFNFENWAKAVRKGNTFVTSGPLLTFTADGRVPGEEISLGSQGGTVEVHAEATCFVPIHSLDVILNGQVVASREEPSGTRAISLHEKVKVPGSGWLAARCASRLDRIISFQIAAHTSPVYVQVPGEELFSAPAVAYMLSLITGAEAWLENLATRPGPRDFDRVRKVFVDARAELHRRLHKHGIAH